jgi:hypothetical protein
MSGVFPISPKHMLQRLVTVFQLHMILQLRLGQEPELAMRALANLF